VTTESRGAEALSDRYATALFELAEDGKQLDAVAGDLAGLQALISESGDLRRLIRSPVISRRDQQRAMAAVLERAKMADITRRFIGVVARNRRLFAFPSIIVAYQEMLANRRGLATAQVVSAKALSAAQIEAIGMELKKATGATVAVDARVDPSLLGGLVVKVGSRMVDSSLSTKLQRLRLAMKGVG